MFPLLHLQRGCHGDPCDEWKGTQAVGNPFEFVLCCFASLDTMASLIPSSLPSLRVNSPRKRWIRWLIPAAKATVFALLCWFIYYTFVSANERLGAHTWHVEPQWLVVSGILYLLGLLPAAIFWQRVLVATGQNVGLGESLRAYYISQLGKYVPGKWMVILLRRVSLHSSGLEETVVAASVFFETFTMLAVGSALAAVMLAIWQPEKPLLVGAAAISVLLMGIPTVPAVFQWLIRKLGVDKLNPKAGAKFSCISPRTIAFGWSMIAVGWLLQGMSLWATLRSLGAVDGGPFSELSLHTATVALSVVAGFISQIPGGLGMREGVSAELIEPQYGPAIAIVSAIIFRLVLLVSETMVSIILYAAGWLRTRKPAAEVEAELSASGIR